MFPDAIRCHYTCIMHSDMSVSFEAITVPVVRSTHTAWLPAHFLLHPAELGLDAGVGTLFAP